jgi:hypothetical protein
MMEAKIKGCQPLGAAVMPAIAKIIHRKGMACIQSHQPYSGDCNPPPLPKKG